jgi:hypothetical protein
MLKYIYLLLSIKLILSKKEEQKVDVTVYDNIVNAIKIKDYNEIDRHLNTTDITYFLYFYNKTGSNSVMGAYYLQRLDRKLDYITKIFLVECNELIQKDVKQCQIHNNTTFDPYPQFELLVPPLYRFDPKTKEMNTHASVRFSEKSVSEDTLYKYIIDNIVSYSSQIENKEILDVFTNQPVFNKVILFTEKETTPLIYKGLSNYYYDRLLFGEIRANYTDLVKEFNVSKFPTIVLLENGFLVNEKPKVHHYQGSTKPGELIKFLDEYALRGKYYVRNNYEKILIKQGIKILNNNDYESFFEEAKDRKKAIYFTNGESDFNSLSLELKSFITATNVYIAFGNLDCTKYKKICEKEFRVKNDKLPKLVLFDKGDNFYSVLESAVELASGHGLFNFFSKGNNIKELSSQDYLIMIRESRKNQRHPIIYLNKGKDLVAALPFHIIASIPEYGKRFDFYSISNPSKDVLDHLRVPITLPSVAILLHEVKDK